MTNEWGPHLRGLVSICGIAIASCGGPGATLETQNPPARPSGPCERAEVDTMRTWSVARAALRSVALDLDHDGAEDVALTEEGVCGSGGCTYRVYLRDGECDAYLGEVRTRELDVLDSSTRGIADIRVAEHSGSCHLERAVARFDGHRYRLEERELCVCVPLEATLTCEPVRD